MTEGFDTVRGRQRKVKAINETLIVKKGLKGLVTEKGSMLLKQLRE